MRRVPVIDKSMAVSEWELRGCFSCDPDDWAKKHGDPEVNGLKVRHILMGHDRDAACAVANQRAQRWNDSIDGRA